MHSRSLQVNFIFELKYSLWFMGMKTLEYSKLPAKKPKFPIYFNVPISLNRAAFDFDFRVIFHPCSFQSVVCTRSREGRIWHKIYRFRWHGQLESFAAHMELENVSRWRSLILIMFQCFRVRDDYEDTSYRFTPSVCERFCFLLLRPITAKLINPFQTCNM